jgi:hypothetical protein
MADYKQLVQEAGGFLRTAERNMFSGKNQEAVELLNKADDLAAEAAKIQADDFQVKSLQQKVEKMRKDLERKGVVTRPGGKEELPFEVNAQLQRIKESVINGNLEYARREMDNYYSRFAGPHTDIPEIKEMKALIEKMEAEEAEKRLREAANAQSQTVEREAHEKLCEQWREKFRTVPYFDGTPHNVFDLAAQVEACKKAVAVVNEYMKVNFSLEPDITLQSMVEDVKRRVESFIPNYNNTLNEMSGEIIERIEGFIRQLESDTAWKDDETKMPGFVGQSQMNSLLNSIEEMRPVCEENMQVFNDMMAVYQRLSDLNEEHKLAHSKAMRMKPEKMSGPEAEPLKQAASEALLNKHTGAVILKSVVTKAWENKFEEGWEDNTKSKWVKRSFREATVQIAAKLTTGDCKLFTMYVEESRVSDTEYGNTKSHIMFEDNINEENI